MTVEDLAQKIQNDVENSSEKLVFIDPMSIMLYIAIINAIINAVRLFCILKKNRESAEKVSQECRQPGLGTRILVTRQVRKHLGIKDFRKNGAALVDKILRSGADLSLDEIETLL